MDERSVRAFGRELKRTLNPRAINQLGRETGQAKRLRVVTPARLVGALITALGCFDVESLADLLRQFNHQMGTRTAYKAFYMRLARESFPQFMRAVFERLLSTLSSEVLGPEPSSALTAFSDVVTQDGTSFAVKHTLASTFPGRFKTVEPAAVELHVTYSGFRDAATRVALTPDTTQERAFLPPAGELAGKLLLADRGYPSVPYFETVDDAGGSFVVRLTRSWKPTVTAWFKDGQMHVLQDAVPLASFLSHHRPSACLDLEVAFKKGKRSFRLVVLPGKTQVLLCTNLDRQTFELSLVARLYRLRWQIELLFKEWKSYANLHKFDTSNPHIAEGLIWASLCAAVVKRRLATATEVATLIPMSTRRVAMAARHVLAPIVSALLAKRGDINKVLASAVCYLSTNASRSNPKRDRASGRLRLGLRHLAVA